MINRGVSIWQASCPAVETTQQQLQDGEKTEVLIIGGGMTGILCALFLREAGVRTILVDAGRIGQNCTGLTTAKITAQHGLIYAKMLRKQGKEKTALYLDAAEDALRKYQEIIDKYQIDCAFTPCSNFVYLQQDRRALHREMEALMRLDYPARYVKELPLPLSVAGAVEFPEQAQFNPLQLIAGLRQAALAPQDGFKIIEDTAITHIDARGGETADGRRVEAGRVIVATHFPPFKLRGAFALRMHQERAYVVAGNAGDAPLLTDMYIDGSGTGLSFRGYKDLTIVGGPSSRAGGQKLLWPELEQQCEAFYPGWETQYCWANQDCITLDDMPYIGESGNLLVSTGYNKWGMTGAMTGATLLTDLLLGRKSPYAALFRPDRSLLHPKLLNNGLVAAGHLLTPTKPRCTHLGCALVKNELEGSWDCACHGSRFHAEGECLCAPASKNAKILSKKVEKFRQI